MLRLSESQIIELGPNRVNQSHYVLTYEMLCSGEAQALIDKIYEFITKGLFRKDQSGMIGHVVMHRAPIFGIVIMLFQMITEAMQKQQLHPQDDRRLLPRFLSARNWSPEFQFAWRLFNRATPGDTPEYFLSLIHI